MKSYASLRGGLSSCLSIFLCLLSCASLQASGTANLHTATDDPVMLFVGHPTFGNFAVYGAPSTSRLNFRIADLNETVYIGMSRAFRRNGTPENFGQFKYRIRRSSDDAIVFGPQTINLNTQNLDNLQQAQIGPAALAAGGYPTDANSTFQPTQTGEYYLEFEQDRFGNPLYIGLWDITVAGASGRIGGRVYSKNWAFRVPSLNPTLPDCEFGAEMNAVFYSYTADGFVTEIDFTDSGFQPLSFNLAFNRTGPGNSGNLDIDRQSVPDINASQNAAEHLIFLEEPDVLLFPDGTCGVADITGPLQCQGLGNFCIPITVSQPGQTDILLDFNQNGVYDEGLDRIIVYAFEHGNPLTTCVPWDGLQGDGSRAPDGARLDIIMTFNQGLQHWSLYDAERMTNGFCVRPVRPICGSGGATRLFYDDINIRELPGTGAPKRQLEGCDCRTAGCRTWDNFVSNASANCTIIDKNTTGYGDRSTLNTWWSAASNFVSSLDVPVSITNIDGPSDFCPGDSVELTLTEQTVNPVTNISWTGPAGPIVTSGLQYTVAVDEPGLYSATLMDSQGCASTSTFMLDAVACTINPRVVSVSCDDAGTPSDPSDDVYFAGILVSGTNSPDFTHAGNVYAYGDTVSVGPFTIAAGDVTLNFTDNFYSCCTAGVTIMAPAACSQTCAISSVQVMSTDCHNAGTVTDPADDTFTFDMLVDGNNVSSQGWTNGAGLTGQYGVVTTFGPFPIAGGTVNASFTDATDSNCSIVVTVQPPPTCSDDCALTPTVVDLTCDDNGTPYNPADDTYSFDLSVTGINAPSIAYNVNGSGAYLYGNVNRFGPYSIEGSDFTFDLADLADGACNFSFTLPDPPTSCSNACGIEVVGVRQECVDVDGEGRLFADVLVRNQNPSASTWEFGGGVQGTFDTYVRLGEIPQGGRAVTFTLTETNRSQCTASITVSSPAPVVECPATVSTVRHPFASQSFERQLVGGSASIPATESICWLPEADLTGGGVRHQNVLSVARATNGRLRTFSFYLLGPPGSEYRSALFNVPTDAPRSCDQLVNSEPVTSSNPVASATPELPAGNFGSGLVVLQSFSAALRPDQEYSLVTTTLEANTSGLYRWVILSADFEELTFGAAQGPAPTVETGSVDVRMDLLTAEVLNYADVFGSEDEFGLPTVDSLCEQATFAFKDSTSRTCDRAQISRSFDLILTDTTLRDVCQQRIEFRSVGLTDIIWPAKSIDFPCDADYPVLASGYPDPAYTGVPTVYQGGIVTPIGVLTQGELSVRFSDEERTENGKIVVIRTWTVVSDCDAAEREYEQRFLVSGGGAPFFSCPISNHYCPIVEEDIMLWGMEPFTCSATVDIPEPDISNICDTTGWAFVTEVFTLTANGDSSLLIRLLDGDERTLENLSAGDYLIRYTGSHPDETVEARTCRIRVADLDDPVAACKRNLNFSMPGSGLFVLPFSVVDQGSYDNCGIVESGLRRPGDSLWMDRVFFDCDDVGMVQTVQLRVADAAGNENFCVAQISVRDNTLPYCTGLEDLTVSCDELPATFQAFDTTELRLAFGFPEVVDNCSATARELAPEVRGDNCSPESIVRRFRALDQHGNFSAGIFTQTITVVPATEYTLRFPADGTTDCVVYPDSLLIQGGGCDSITYTVAESYLPATGTECRILVRDYLVTNWCEWDGVSAPTVIGRDENCLAAEGQSVWLVRNVDGAFIDVDDRVDNNLPAAASCGGNPAGYLRELGAVNGRYAYRQLIRIEDETAPTFSVEMLDMICADTSFCRTRVTAAVTVTDACQMEEGSVVVGIDFSNDGNIEGTSNEVGTFEGTFPDYKFSLPLPIGEHRFEFTVTDDCGNTSVEERVFRVTDCYVPALRCVQNRVYELEAQLNPTDVDGDGEVEEAFAIVEALDLGQCNFTDCSGELVYSVNRVGEAIDPTQNRLYLDCKDRYRVDLELYVWDHAFNPFATQPDGSVGGPNWRMCLVTVFVQDPTLACTNCQVGEELTINGFVNSVDGTAMEGVRIKSVREGRFTESDRFGSYQLSGEVGESYVLQAELADDDPRAGVSALDLVLLRRIILQVEQNPDPYTLLAADLNQDGRVTSADLIHLQALVLARTDFYPPYGPWRFIEASWEGEQATPETITLLDLETCSEDNNWVGIRTGDLNGSYTESAGVRTAQTSQGRVSPNAPIAVQIEDRNLKAGEETTLQVRLGSTTLIGGQLGLYWADDQFEVLGVESTVLAPADYRIQPGQLWIAWKEALTDGSLVALRVRARRELRTSAALFTRRTSAFADEAYDVDLGVHELYIDWTVGEARPAVATTAVTPEQSPGDILLGIYPNPVRDNTRIGLRTQTKFDGQFRLHNEFGQTIFSEPIRLSAGENWISVDMNSLPSGTYLAVFDDGTMRTVAKIVRQ